MGWEEWGKFSEPESIFIIIIDTRGVFEGSCGLKEQEGRGVRTPRRICYTTT